MSGKFQDLRELLVKYLSCYEEFYEVQTHEKEFLTKMNMQDLTSNNNRKETIALEVKMMEESRLHLCESIADDFGVDAGDVNFEFVIKNSPHEFAAEFQELATSMRALSRKLERINETNRRLVLSSMNTVRNLEKVLRGLVNEQATYRPSGDMEPAPRASNLVCRTL